jgi:hypothetical protein
MASNYFEVTYGGVPITLYAEFDSASNVLPSNAEVEKTVYAIAKNQILAKGKGIVGAHRVRDLMQQKRPKNTLTDPAHPGVYVWFPK